ncbi:MAG: hypothetical protein ABR552_11395, partial [Actinomycetota bacterium]
MNVLIRFFALTHAPSKRARVTVLMMLAVGAAMLTAAIGNASVPASVVSATTSGPGDGHINQITVTFATPLQPQSVKVSSGPNDPGIYVDGYQASSAAVVDATTLRIDLVESAVYDTGATPTLHYVPFGA